ncbi:MAG: hypothetical protein AAF492_16235, partial [Verrucomicrobiota bacterium]
LLVFMNSHSCAPCIRLEKNVLQNEVFERFAEESLVLCRIDFADAFKRIPGKPRASLTVLKKKSKVPSSLTYKGWPYLFLLSSEGEVLHKGLERRRLKAGDFVKQYTDFLAATGTKPKAAPAKP